VLPELIHRCTPLDFVIVLLDGRLWDVQARERELAAAASAHEHRAADLEAAAADLRGREDALARRGTGAAASERGLEEREAAVARRERAVEALEARIVERTRHAERRTAHEGRQGENESQWQVRNASFDRRRLGRKKPAGPSVRQMCSRM
jgi:uncharacterized protein (DUF3084 family)